MPPGSLIGAAGLFALVYAEHWAAYLAVWTVIGVAMDIDPEKARKLLAEAGYPNGFKTNVVTMGSFNELLEVFKAYFKDINVDMEIRVMDSTAFSLCRDNCKPIVVFNMNQEGNITKAMLGEPIGTLVTTTAQRDELLSAQAVSP